MDRSSLQYIVPSISIIYIDRRIVSCASFGYMWKWCTSCSIWSFRGSLWYVLSSFPSLFAHINRIQANYYIAFSILSSAMVSMLADPDHPTSASRGMAIFDRVIDYFYLGLLIMCFILSLGNRPQGSKWGYTMAIIGFGIITIYMTVRWNAGSSVCDSMIFCVRRRRRFCWRSKGLRRWQKMGH